MGCVHSTSSYDRGEEYIETLTLKRKVTKKVNGKRMKISISVIADPVSSDENVSLNHDLSDGHQIHDHCACDKASYQDYQLENMFSNRPKFSTISGLDSKRLTRFPKSKRYNICYDCKENKEDVHKTITSNTELDLCRKCSLKKKKTKDSSLVSKNADPSVKKIDMAAFASLLALVSDCDIVI